MEPLFPFDLTLPAPGAATLTDSLHRQLRSAIVEGRVSPGTQLPATRRTAAALGIARNTVVKVYDLLVAEGYLLSRRGAKPTVADVARRAPHSIRRRSVGTGLLNRAWRTPFVRFAPSGDPPGQSFRLGIPDHRYFPHETWRKLSARALRTLSRQPFRYPPTEGIAELREAIARHVADTRAVACTGDDVVVTSGAQQAFDVLARLLVTPGHTRVAVEEPGYPPLRAAFAAAGARLVPVPIDDEGLCVDRLPADAHVIVTTPSHQFPTGVALTLRRRAALLDFARTHRAVIVEDDYDGEFRFGGRPLDALQTLDRDALVFYVGTVSKSLFPSLRKGFVVAPAWARDPLVAIKECADSHCDALTQSVLAYFIREGHLARHVRRMRSEYAARRDVLLDGLQRQLGNWLEPIPSEAGLHLAARIREPELATDIVAKARRLPPGAQSTADYSTSPPKRPALAFGYGVIDAADIPAALSRLRRALER